MHSKAVAKFCLFGAIGGVWLSSCPAVDAQTIQPSGTDTWSSLGRSNENVTLAGESKLNQNPPATQDLAPLWSFNANLGYTSEYNFRGTNLTPGSDGAGYVTVNVSAGDPRGVGSFTFGIYGIHQFGTASANSFSIGEGGAGGSVAQLVSVPGQDNLDNNLSFTGTLSPVTTQKRFNEVDVYLTYTHEIGPLNITIGNIAFFIDREATTRITTRGILVDGVVDENGVLMDPNGDEHTYTVNGETVEVPTVGSETFDRLFIAVSAPRLFQKGTFSVIPKIYYYQTVFNDGDDPFSKAGQIIVAHDLSSAGLAEAAEGFPHYLAINGLSERNSSLGGYLEGRVDASFSLTPRVRVKPYALISYSFHDRTEPYEASQNIGFKQFIRSRSLVGFNNAQAGMQIPIELWRSPGPGGSEAVLTFAPLGAYSYHISQPPAGTDRNEVWGGAQFELTF